MVLGKLPACVRGASRVDDAKVTCPVLVVAGAQDRITPASVVRKVAQKYKAVSTYKEFANHAHWVVAEPRWQEVAEYILGRLAGEGAEKQDSGVAVPQHH